jgi:hypothetical protein
LALVQTPDAVALVLTLALVLLFVPELLPLVAELASSQVRV